MKKLVLPLMLMIFLLTGCGSFNKADKIVVGIDDEFAPMSFHNEQNILVGFDIDLAREAANRMGIEIEFKPIIWDSKREEITSGNIDLIWNGLDITEERSEYMIFTKPYMDDRQIILVRKGYDQGIHAEEDIAGKIIGTQAGSTSDDYISGNEYLKNNLKGYKTYKRFNEVVEALRNEEIEILICDEMIARYEMKTHPDDFELLNVKIGSVAEMVVGFRKDEVELRDRVQAAFDEMVKDGTAREISEKWFHADLIKPLR